VAAHAVERPPLCRKTVLGCLPLQEASRHTERAEGRPEQHNCGAAIWDRNCRMRHRAALGAGVLAKRKHCGTKDHSNQREFPYGNDIVFHICQLSKLFCRIDELEGSKWLAKCDGVVCVRGSIYDVTY